MHKKLFVAALAGLMVFAGFGCSGKKPAAPAPKAAVDNQLPADHPSFGATDKQSKPGKAINGDAVAKKVLEVLDQKYPGEWTVSGTTLKKGNYTENKNYGLADEVAKAFNGGMVSIFVGETRISSTVRGQDFSGYPTPPEIGQTMKSGKVLAGTAGSLGNSAYQKVYVPLKADGKTIAVISVSVSQ